jgi:hypothetical protein
MTMTTTRPTRRTSGGGHAAAAAQRLRLSFAAARVSFTWLGVRKTLSPDQKAQAAESFGAEGQFLSAAKKLLDTQHPAYKAVSAVRAKIQAFWRDLSLPYPEPGVRLIKQEDVGRFDRELGQYRRELTEAVTALDRQYAELRASAQMRLGSLYNPADYPDSLRGLFEVNWDFPSVEPPEYLLRLNPQLYQEERERIAARFNEAVKLAEQAFVAELAKLVDHLVERLNAGPEGEKKVFRDSAITNLTEFFDRFKSLNVGSSAELDRLVETAQRAIQGVEPEAVRNSESLRQHVSTQLSAVAATLDGLLVDAPRRRILRPVRTETT